MFRLNNPLPRLLAKLNGVKLGKRISFYGIPVLFRFPSAKIEIGDDTVINSSFLSNLLGLYQRTIIVAKGQGMIKIGQRLGISGSTIYSWSSIEIGDDTIIGANVKVLDTDFHPIDPQMRLVDRTKGTKTKPIIIGKNVFIGTNAIILKGTTIGDDCVVGAGSVVHGSFPKGSIIAGNPARIIRSGETARDETIC